MYVKARPQTGDNHMVGLWLYCKLVGNLPAWKVRNATQTQDTSCNTRIDVTADQSESARILEYIGNDRDTELYGKGVSNITLMKVPGAKHINDRISI